MWSRLIEAWYRITASFRRRRLERDLDEEISFHLAMRQTNYVAGGSGMTEARHQAQRRFGNVTALKEQMRGLWTFPSIDSIWQDVKYAARTLRRQPGFTAVAVLILSAVTGLNTSLITVMTALSFHPPAGISDPSGVVSLYPAVPPGEPPFFSVAEYRFVAEQAKSLGAAAIAELGKARIGPAGANGTTVALLVSANFFETLGITLQHGRGFVAGEDRPDAPQAVAVLGAALWESRFAGDATVIGRAIVVNDVPLTVVGIAPRDFVGLEPAAQGRPGLFVPIAAVTLLRPELSSSQLGSASILGRLARDATREQVRAEVDVLLRRFHREAGTEPRGVLVTSTAFLAHPGRSVILGFLGLISLALMLVWLLACANVGNLQLARAAARAQEVGIRLSLGATRGRIVRQLLIEGFVLASAACALGVGLAYALPRMLLRVVGDQAAVDAVNFSLAPDLPVLAYAILLAAASSVAFGLAPALHVTADVAGALKDRESQSRSRFPLRSVLLGVQVAVSVVVLVAAGLLLRRVQLQASFDPGVPIDNVSVVTFQPAAETYLGAARTNAFVADVTDALRQLPIDAFGFATAQPFGFGGTPTLVHLPGETSAQARQINYVSISPGYLEVLRVPLTAGRPFEPADAPRPVALVNEAMARRYWPNDNPIGKTFFAGRSESLDVVGVVRNISTGVNEVYPTFYRPLGAKAGGGIEMSGGRRVVGTDVGPIPALLVRPGGAAATDAVAAAIARIDARMHLQTRPLSATLEEMRQAFRVGPILAGLLGAFAVGLAAVGMFGVFAYAVRQRTREIGIRMALGAQSADVVRLILSGHSRAVLGGLVVGLAGALAASHILRGFLYGVSPFDPVAYLGVAVVLLCAGLAASYVPARRATRIDPIEALRCD